MKKNQKVMFTLMAMVLTACGNQVSSKNEASSPVESSPVVESSIIEASSISSSVASSSSEVSSSLSSSETPVVNEAPTIDKVAAELERCLSVGLSSYTYSNRVMDWNYVFGTYNDNVYYTIDAKQYTNGSDSIKTEYLADSHDLTFDRVYGVGPLRTYKLDDDYYVYAYVSDRVNLDQNHDFVDILERNRYHNETDMEYYSNCITAVLDAFDGTSFWPESSGYELVDYSVRLDGDYYYCEIGATAPETDQYREEDNYAWVKMNAYTYAVEEAGVYMQAMNHSSTDYAGEIGSITKVSISNIVCEPLVEGEIEPFDLDAVPSYLISDARPTFFEVPEGEISGDDALKIMRNMKSYVNGTNYSHHEFSQDVYGRNPETQKYEKQYVASCFEDYVRTDKEIMTVASYMDDDNDDSTPHALQQLAVNYCTDDGIVCSITSVAIDEQRPQFTTSYTYDKNDLYSLEDYLNPSGYYNGYYSMVFREVTSLGWGAHETTYQSFEYELVKATNTEGVFDIEFHINFEETQYIDAHTDVYVIQITDNFCNMIAKKTNGAADFDTFYNYKVEPLNY